MPTSMTYSERGVYDYLPGQQPKVTENTRYDDDSTYENSKEAEKHEKKLADGNFFNVMLNLKRPAARETIENRLQLFVIEYEWR